VLLIAVLLRFMDSFMIYTSRRGDARSGNSTTFVSSNWSRSRSAIDLGKAAALSLVYNLSS